MGARPSSAGPTPPVASQSSEASAFETPARRFLRRRATPLACALLAVVLTLPALRAGLIGDDYFQRLILLGRIDWGAGPALSLFSFVPDSQRENMIQLGVLPWWCDPHLRVAFARPIAALTHVADYRLWPDNIPLQHVQSLMWFGFGVGLVAALYRRLHGATMVAGLAAVFYAVDDAHAWPAAWLANRNALLCLACGTGVILLHLAWRRSRRPTALFAALAGLAIGLGCGEATLGGLAYVAAWQLTEERGTWPSRLAPLLPYAAVVAFWRFLYGWAGYGALNSALYVDPGAEPVRFLGAAAERWPLLIAGQWLLAPLDLWVTLPRAWQLIAAIISLTLAVGLLALLWNLLRADREARFWLLGMALSIVPLCAAFPMSRLLIFPGIGAFAALALLLRQVGTWPWPRQRVNGWRRRAAFFFLVLHLPVASALLVLHTATLQASGSFFAAGARQSPQGAEAAGQTFVFVNGNDFTNAYTWIVRRAEGSASCPRRIAGLSSMTARNVVHREDSHTVLVAPEGGFLAHPIDSLLANPNRSFVVGDRMEHRDFVAEVRAVTADGRPGRVAFRFRFALEDSSYRWLYWNGANLEEFELPGIGDSAVVARANLF